MDSKTKAILIFLGSFITGAAAGGVGAYMYTKKYYQRKSDEEIQNMTEYYINKYNPEKGESANDKIDEIESDDKIRTEEVIEGTSIYDYSGNEEGPVTSYGKCFDNNSSAVDNIPSSIKKKKSTKRKKKLDIEQVDDDVWNDNPGGFDTKFLVYYDADSVLIDEESEKVVDDSDYIKTAIDESTDDGTDTIILQDNTNSTLYHVTIERMAYNEVMVDD